MLNESFRLFIIMYISIYSKNSTFRMSLWQHLQENLYTNIIFMLYNSNIIFFFFFFIKPFQAKNCLFRLYIVLLQCFACITNFTIIGLQCLYLQTTRFYKGKNSEAYSYLRFRHYRFYVERKQVI